MPKWRPLTWIILVVNVLFLVWLIGGVNSASDTSDCVGEFSEACKTGTEIGTGIGAILIIFLWALVDVILGVIWLVTRKNDPAPAMAYGTAGAPAGTTRACPFCAEQIQRAATVCRHCGRDVPVGEAPPIPAGHCRNCGAAPSRPPTANCLSCGSPMRSNSNL